MKLQQKRKPSCAQTKVTCQSIGPKNKTRCFCRSTTGGNPCAIDTVRTAADQYKSKYGFCRDKADACNERTPDPTTGKCLGVNCLATVSGNACVLRQLSCKKMKDPDNATANGKCGDLAPKFVNFDSHVKGMCCRQCVTKRKNVPCHAGYIPAIKTLKKQGNKDVEFWKPWYKNMAKSRLKLCCTKGDDDGNGFLDKNEHLIGVHVNHEKRYS